MCYWIFNSLFSNMSTPASTLLVTTLDAIKLPPKMLLAICKHLFSRFGLKFIQQKGNGVLVSLNYTPVHDTLQRKFGNLPVQYVRLGVSEQDEVQMIATALRNYTFDLSKEDDLSVIIPQKFISLNGETSQQQQQQESITFSNDEINMTDEPKSQKRSIRELDQEHNEIIREIREDFAFLDKRAKR